MNNKTCPIINPKKWDLKKHQWKQKPFYKVCSFKIFNKPILLKRKIQKTKEKIKSKGLGLKEKEMCLFKEKNIFYSEILIPLEGTLLDDKKIIKLNGEFFSKYYEGPKKGLEKAKQELKEYLKKDIEEFYYWFLDFKEKENYRTIIFAKLN